MTECEIFFSMTTVQRKFHAKKLSASVYRRRQTKVVSVTPVLNVESKPSLAIAPERGFARETRDVYIMNGLGLKMEISM